MKARFSENLTFFILSLALFLILIYVLNADAELAFSLILILAVWLNEPIRKVLRAVFHHHTFLRINDLTEILTRFNNDLNRITDYHQMITAVYQTLTLLFPEGRWCLYVREDGEYHLTRADWPGSEPEKLPRVMKVTEIPRKQLIKKAELKLSGTEDGNLIPDVFVMLEGKEEILALIGTRKQNLNFLLFPEIRPLFERIMRKSGQMLENARIYTESVEKHKQIQRLIEISEKLLSSLSTKEILTSILEALKDLIPYDAAVIFLLDEDSKLLHPKASKGYDDEVDLTLKVGQGACGWVAENKQISLLVDVNDSDHYYPVRKATRSQATLPLMIQDELMGVLCLESNSKGYFNDKSLELLNLFANLAVIALNNARQYEISLAKKTLENELIKAGNVQKVLLPRQPPVYKDLNISFEHIASEIVSGDLFDLVPLNDRTLGLLIGDVSGKGAHAAIMMSLVLAGFRAYRKSHLEVCEVVARLNNLLQESISDGRYATLFYCMISIDSASITYTNAGHNPPILLHQDGSFDHLTGGGIVLGYLPNESFTQHRMPFLPGDILVCYTDGVTEALNRQGEEFGESRLQSVLINNRLKSAYDLRNSVLREIRNFTHSKKLSDDITLLIIKHL